ncbi:hypothetical protein QTH97_15275 [Variovorax sp. J22R24]|uniref:hypothetical protein n=1 Tax=Variovorax gracilis TaxID=3053502 RepID=UPI00257744E8|nr:hypothetical protein [Variovorax sp. J22R24]MDM0106307.1 hypothetical protein [Variovorax sp. J22R24]
MNSQGFDANPTVADEVSAVVDDAQVIAKTLPSRRVSRPTHTLMDIWGHGVDATRDFVNREPMQAVMIAAAASSLLTMVLTRRARDWHA